MNEIEKKHRLDRLREETRAIKENPCLTSDDLFFLAQSCGVQAACKDDAPLLDASVALVVQIGVSRPDDRLSLFKRGSLDFLNEDSPSVRLFGARVLGALMNSEACHEKTAYANRLWHGVGWETDERIITSVFRDLSQAVRHGLTPSDSYLNQAVWRAANEELAPSLRCASLSFLKTLVTPETTGKARTLMAPLFEIAELGNEKTVPARALEALSALLQTAPSLATEDAFTRTLLFIRAHFQDNKQADENFLRPCFEILDTCLQQKSMLEKMLRAGDYGSIQSFLDEGGSWLDRQTLEAGEKILCLLQRPKPSSSHRAKPSPTLAR